MSWLKVFQLPCFVYSKLSNKISICFSHRLQSTAHNTNGANWISCSAFETSNQYTLPNKYKSTSFHVHQRRVEELIKIQQKKGVNVFSFGIESPIFMYIYKFESILNHILINSKRNDEQLWKENLSVASLTICEHAKQFYYWNLYEFCTFLNKVQKSLFHSALFE